MDHIRLWVAAFAVVVAVGTPLQLWAQAAEPFDQEPPAPEDLPAAWDEEPTPEPGMEPEPEPMPSAEASGSAEVSLGAQFDADADASATAAPAAPAKDAEEKGEKEEEILVTGSRIKRHGFNTPTPVTVMEREQIERSGASNMADLIRMLTANSGSETQFGLGQGADGFSNFNLRGLGIANTLVLVNGRRLVAYPDSFGVTNSASFADMNQIPLQFVDRLEIAKGGASAIYGSDAIAGVINIILRDDFEGAAVSLTGFTTDRWDQQDGEVAVIFGANSDDSSVVAQASYFKRAPLGAVDRDFTDGTLASTVGFPGTFIVLRPDGTRETFTDPGCGASGSDSFLNEAGNRCMFSYRKDWNLFNDEKRILAYVTAEHRPSDLFQLFGEVGFARKEFMYTSSPSYPLLRSVIVPADHPDNPYGDRAVFLGRPFGRASGTVFQLIDIDGYRGVGGLRGELDDAGMTGWTWELAVTWHMNEHLRRNADILHDNFQEAVNSCSDPTDLSNCFNPWYSAIDGTGTVNSAEVVDYIDGQYKAKNNTEMVIGDVGLSGPIVALPGGDLGAALGAQMRRNKQYLDYDNDAEDRAYSFWIGEEDWSGSQNVVAGYAELSLPLAQGFEIQPAVRAEHYEDIETSVNPRAGISWALGESFETGPALEGLLLRGSVGTAFRAPNLIQTKGSVTNLEQFNLPTGPVFRGALTKPNPNLKSEKSWAFSVGFEWLFEGLSAAMDFWQYHVADLIMRQSAQGYVATVLANAAADGTPLSQTRGSDNINFTPGTDNIESVEITYENQDEIDTNGIDFMISYRIGMGSGGDLTPGAGGTYTLSYTVPDSPTTVPDLSLDDGARTERQDGCDGDVCDIAGKRNENNFARPIPRLRMRFPVVWSLSGHVANITVNYISGYDDDANYDDATGELESIDAWVTLDFGYSYRLDETAIGSSTEFRVGINNLIGSDPPEVQNTNFGYDIFTHDPRGRIFYGNLTHKF